MATVKAGPAIPVRVVTTGNISGGPAKAVWGYRATPSDRSGAGGAAIPVKVLVASDLVQNGGKYKLDGDSMAIPIYTAPAGAIVQDGPVLAVWPVNSWP